MGGFKLWAVEPPIVDLQSDQISKSKAIVIGGLTFISVSGQYDRRLTGSAEPLSVTRGDICGGGQCDRLTLISTIGDRRSVIPNNQDRYTSICRFVTSAWT